MVASATDRSTAPAVMKTSDVGLGTRRHVDGVVADAEPADRQQVSALGDGLSRHRRRQHDDPVRPFELVGPDGGAVLSGT